MNERCKWRLERFVDVWTDERIWVTECREMFEDNTSYLLSTYVYCPECGKKIEYVGGEDE